MKVLYLGEVWNLCGFTKEALEEYQIKTPNAEVLLTRSGKTEKEYVYAMVKFLSIYKGGFKK